MKVLLIIAAALCTATVSADQKVWSCEVAQQWYDDAEADQTATRGELDDEWERMGWANPEDKFIDVLTR